MIDTQRGLSTKMHVLDRGIDQSIDELYVGFVKDVSNRSQKLR